MQDDAANRSPTAAIAALHSGVWSSSSTDGVPRGVTGSKRTLDASIVGESGASTGALASAFVAASIAAFTSKVGRQRFRAATPALAPQPGREARHGAIPCAARARHGPTVRCWRAH